jgi:hypothetical protein
MANEKNDAKILELKKQIEAKKIDLAARKVRFAPETNCVLDLDNNKYNLNVLDDGTLMFLMLKLNLYNMSADNLKIPHLTISGCSVDLWIKDIKSKLAVTGMKREEADLKKMELKLDQLLSEEKKTELELDEIASLLQ